MTVNIKYCGGCNPRYSRGKVAANLQKNYPSHTYTINGEGEFDLLIVLYGCPCICADLSSCSDRSGRFYMSEQSQWKELCRFMDAFE